MKNLNLKKLLAAVAIVVVAGGIGVQKASALEIDESLNPIITSRDFVKEEVKNDNLNKVAEEDIMNPIITSRNFVKEENKMDVRTTASIDDVMNPIITSETILSHK